MGAAGVARRFKLVVIGASAGGLASLTEVLSHLPADFQLPVLIVQHIDRHHASVLASILNRRSKVRVQDAVGGETPAGGTVYVAPSDHHLQVSAAQTLELCMTPLVHFARPSVDRLFETAAENAGPVIGIILSGSGSDGAEGARAIRAAGGVVIVEDVKTAAFVGMPQATIDTGVADFVVSAADIPALLLTLAGDGQ